MRFVDLLCSAGGTTCVGAVDCDTDALRLYHTNFSDQGDPEQCAHKDRVNAGLLTRQRDVDDWLQS